MHAHAHARKHLYKLFTMERNPLSYLICCCQAKLFLLTAFAFDKKFEKKKEEKLLVVTNSVLPGAPREMSPPHPMGSQS